MNKEQQIEEMAVIGCVRNPQAKTAEECGKCDFRQGMCNAYRHAENLYNAGYRKTFTSDFASDTQKAFKEGYEKGLDVGIELNKALHDEKCAEFNKLCYGYAKLKAENAYLEKALSNAVKINEAGEKELLKIRKQTAKDIAYWLTHRAEYCGGATRNATLAYADLIRRNYGVEEKQ